MGCCISSDAESPTPSAPPTLSLCHILNRFEVRPVRRGSYHLRFTHNGVVLKRTMIPYVNAEDASFGPRDWTNSISVPLSNRVNAGPPEWLTIDVTQLGLADNEYLVMRAEVNLSASVTAEGSTVVLPCRTLYTTNAANTVAMTHTLSGRVTTTADRSSLVISEQATRPGARARARARARATKRRNTAPQRNVSTNGRIGEKGGRTTAPYEHHIDINHWMDDVGGPALKLPETDGAFRVPFGRQLSDAVFSAEGDPLCVVCMAEPPSVTLMPCKHRIMCEDCAARWLPLGHNCPVCRAATNGVATD